MNLQKEMNRKQRLLLLLFGMIILIGITTALIFLLGSADPKEANQSKETNQNITEMTITEQIQSFEGLNTVISQEEYAFFEELAKKELVDSSDPELLNQKTQEIINQELSQFYLGSKFGFCQPYSFTNLQMKMEQENTERKLKQEKGEPIYGVTSFDFKTYFEYISDNLRADLINYILDHADDKIEAGGEEFYYSHLDFYQIPDPIVYQITENGTTEEFSVAYSQMKTIERVDNDLSDILLSASEGESYTYEFNGSERIVDIISITYRYDDFESAKSLAMQGFLESEYYDELLIEVARNNPVTVSAE